jgi:hypothetical protein
MNDTSRDTVLVESLQALSKCGLKAVAITSQSEPATRVARLTRDAVAAKVVVYRAHAHLEGLADYERHVCLVISELSFWLSDARVRDLEFVHVYARECASQRLPIDATLQAYRCTLPLLIQWLCDELVPLRGRGRTHARTALAEFAAQYISTVSIAFAAAYSAHFAIFAEADGDRRAELLGILVGGFNAADTREARLLKQFGYLEQRLRFCVAVAQATDPLEMESTARVQRISDAIVECVASVPVRVLVGVRRNLVTAVFSDIRRVSGWTAPQANITERVKECLLGLGPSVLVGLSGEQASPSEISLGLQEATLALEFASVAERVMAFSSLSTRRLLVHRGVGSAHSALPMWFAAFRDANAKSQRELVKTLRALADADMNVQSAARRLKLHANTVYARLQRIEDLTGLNAQRYHHLTDLLLVADCGRL